MKPVNITEVQTVLEQYMNKTVYVHLETTNGAYASHVNQNAYNVGAFIRNAEVKFTNAKIVGSNGTYRVGLKLKMGWIYAEGITDWTITDDDQLLLAGHDREGRLMVALQVSNHPFRY